MGVGGGGQGPPRPPYRFAIGSWNLGGLASLPMLVFNIVRRGTDSGKGCGVLVTEFSSGIVAVGAWRVGEELALAVEAVVGEKVEERRASEECGSKKLDGNKAIGFTGRALDSYKVVANVSDVGEGLGRGAQT